MEFDKKSQKDILSYININLNMEWIELLSPEKRAEATELLNLLDAKRKKYWILSSKLDRVPWQVQLFNDMEERLDKKLEERVRFYLYYGWNWSWKSFVGCYITVLLALGYDTKKYNLPFLWSKKNIWIVTKSGSNVKSTIMPYLLWDYSWTRIPEEMIEKVTQDNGILKAVSLKNWCTIHIKTYDQWQENVQWGNPDWMWLDEEPVNQDVWGELKARTRTKNCEMLITMTPLNGLTGVYDFFFWNDNKELEAKCKIYRVSSLDNPHTDKTWTLWMSAEEYRLRVDGSFESPTGLVYSSFSRSKNIVPYFDPTREEWWKFYKAIDFWTSHPTAIVFLAQDPDDNLYVYDEIKLANTELKEIVRQLTDRSRWVDFEYFVRDSGAAREWLELEKQFWIRTVPADKNSRWANDMSNRRTWILMINNLFHNGKLFIADTCKLLIKELESHYYKDWAAKDWEVIKVNDDLLDAMRYIIYLVKNNYNSNTRKSPILRKFEKENLPKPRRNALTWL